MQIQHLAIESLRANPRNAHTHPKKQIDELAESIRRFGFVTPIVADETRTILAGHGRWQAAKEVGLAVVPVLQLEYLSAAKKRALMLADNKIAEHAGWDRHQLAVELSELSDILVAEGLDISITGFAGPEIDQAIIATAESPSDDRIDPAWIAVDPVSQLGDLWQLGEHRLLCGDPCNKNDVARLVDGEASTAFLRPTGVEFLEESLSAAAAVCRNGAVHFVSSPSHQIGVLLDVGGRVYAETLDLAVCVGSKARQGSFYRAQYDLVAVFRVGRGQLGKELKPRRRSRSNVWRHAEGASLCAGRDAGFLPPSGEKPVALIADAIKDVTNRHDIVLDTFCGLGTTILAAERVGRRCYALEGQPQFVDTSIRRWQAFTGRSATHFETGQNFHELARKRQHARADLG